MAGKVTETKAFIAESKNEQEMVINILQMLWSALEVLTPRWLNVKEFSKSGCEMSLFSKVRREALLDYSKPWKLKESPQISVPTSYLMQISSAAFFRHDSKFPPKSTELVTKYFGSQCLMRRQGSSMSSWSSLSCPFYPKSPESEDPQKIWN